MESTEATADFFSSNKWVCNFSGRCLLKTHTLKKLNKTKQKQTKHFQISQKMYFLHYFRGVTIGVFRAESQEGHLRYDARRKHHTTSV